MQTARALPFKQEVIPGASPSALESTLVKLPEELLMDKPSLGSNLIAGVPPAEILARCEFLEPLSEATLSDYEWLVANLQKSTPVLINRMQHCMSSSIQSFLAKATMKNLWHCLPLITMLPGQLRQCVQKHDFIRKEASATLPIWDVLRWLKFLKFC